MAAGGRRAAFNMMARSSTVCEVAIKQCRMAVQIAWADPVVRNIAESFFPAAKVRKLLMATPANTTPLPAMPPHGLSRVARGRARARGGAQ
eukprot:2191293-Pyramimonas_sp.AAC.1